MQALLDALTHLAPTESAQRLFHGRGGLFAGSENWTLDWFSPVWVLTHFGEVSEADLAALAQALQRCHTRCFPHESLNWVLQERQPQGPGSRARTRLMAGQVPAPHLVSEDGVCFEVRVLQGQNHGLFLDMAEGRRWVRGHAQGAKVLNLFAYTCAFSVVALLGGAQHVINLDMAQGALSWGQKNHRLNGLKTGTGTGTGATFWAHDLFHSWGKVLRQGPYDLVIVDPPSYQKGSFVAHKDWPRVLRRLPECLVPGGHALLCLNAPELPASFLLDLLAASPQGLRLCQRLLNPTAFADISPERSLKVFVVQYAPPADQNPC